MIWKYLEIYDGIGVKHSFDTESSNTANCGRQPTWPGGKWLTDEEGLAKREPCKTCVKRTV